MVQQFVLSSVKINPPRIGVPLLARPRIVQTVREAAERKLLLISAEAGYGKTSLLLSALPLLDRPVAWLTLDESDTDPNLFGAGFVLALRRVAENVGEAALSILTTGPSENILRASILQTLEELPDETLIVLDDFHVLDQTPGAQDLVDHLLEHLPDRVHLAIASRTWPQLRSLPRLLVQGEAIVLDKSRLGFTAEEAVAFLRHSHGLEVAESQAEQLARRTEGWPAALQLVAVATKTRGAPALDGTPREIFDYLATTVLEGLPPETQEFLLRTSVLWEFSPALCEALIDRGEAAALLETLDRRNLFLYRLDEAGTRYRYHQLFAEFLQHQLAQRGDKVIAELHERAGRHLEAAGIGDQAVRHYLAAGAYADAVRVLVPYRSGRLTAQRAYIFRDLVRRLPEAVADGYPWLLRTAASSCRFVGDYQQALAWSRRAMAASDGKDANLWPHSVHGVVVMLASMDRFPEAIATAEDGLARFPADAEASKRADLLQVLASCYRITGRLADARRCSEEALAIATQTEDLEANGIGLLQRGALAAAALKPTEALRAFREAERFALERDSPSFLALTYAACAEAHIALGETVPAEETLHRAQELHAKVGERVMDLRLRYTAGDLALLRGQPEAAEGHYRQTIAQCRDGESEIPKAWAQLGLGRAAIARGDPVAAERQFAEAAETCRRAGFGSILPLVQLEQADLLREIGRGQRGQAAFDVVREASSVFASWDSGPGAARCALLEARLLWDPAGGQALPREVLAVLDYAVALTAAHAPDVMPWLRTRADWVAPLLAAAIPDGPETIDGLLASLGAAGVEPLIESLKRPAARLRALRALSRIGDPRARRPAQRFLKVGDLHVREAAAEALKRLAEPTTPALRVHLFGPFEVYRDGQRIPEGDWKTQKAKALVKLLILQGERGLHQEQIIEWLWPDSDPKTGPVNLKTAVKLARRALEPLLEGSASHFLRRKGEALRFDPAGAWVDLNEYHRLLAEARAHVAAGRMQDANAAFDQAVALCRGDLLEEDRYEDWAAAERERWREAHIEALTELARRKAQQGDYRQAEELTQRVLALDPLRETAYRDLMQYSLLRGNRHEAILTYQTCERVLRDELGVAPHPETTRLLEEARRPA